MRDPRKPNLYARAPIPTAMELNPIKFYSLIDLVRSVSDKETAAVDELIKTMSALCGQADQDVESLAQINNNLLSEVHSTTRRSNPFKTDLENDGDFTDLRHTVSGRSFLSVIFNVASAICAAFHELKGAAEALRPGKLRAQCHRGAGFFVIYQGGHLLVTCGVCKGPVSSHHVAGDGASA